MSRFLIWLGTLFCILAFIGILGVLTLLYYFGQGLPDYEQLAQYEPPVVSRLYASDGRLFGEYATQKRVFVPIEAIPERVIKTFLAAEDKNFYLHPGLDIFGIIRASIVNLSQMGTKKRLVGASTVTQQVAKNLLLANISHKASFERKIKEAILAFRIENVLNKNRILEIYLNEIYLGAGSYGVTAAALQYFNKTLSELSIPETAYLAALPKAPSKYNPQKNYEAAKNRRDWVITRMYEEGVITFEEACAAKKEPITFKKADPKKVVRAPSFAEEVRRHIVRKYGDAALYQGGLTVRTTLDPQIQKITNWALRKGLIAYDRRHGWRGPLDHIDLEDEKKETWLTALNSRQPPPGIGRWELAIVTDLSPKSAKIGLTSGKQGYISLSELKWARESLPPPKPVPGEKAPVYDIFVGPPVRYPEEVLQKGDIILVEKIRKYKKAYSLRQIPEVSGALIVMDPHTGRVLGMSGGFSFESSQFNRVSQAIRQPGSAIKPFVYLVAMEKGFSPATMVSDSPISVAMGYGLGTYAPKNILSRYYGLVPLRLGLQKSLNMMTIRLVHQYIGMKPVAKMIKKFGIMDRVPMQLAMALGAGETTLLRLATAYAMLANGGKKLTATLIDRIQDRHGHTIFAGDTRSCKNCKNIPWSDQSSPLIENLGERLADPRSIYQVTSMLEGAVRAGSARRAQVLKKILAAKTGTTNDERDAWTFAYTPDIVVGAYVGYDSPRTLGDMEGGTRVALPIVISCLSELLEDVPNKPFKIPPGMKLVKSGSSYEPLKKHQSLPRGGGRYGEGSSFSKSSSSSSSYSGRSGLFPPPHPRYYRPEKPPQALHRPLPPSPYGGGAHRRYSPRRSRQQPSRPPSPYASRRAVSPAR